LLLRATIKQSAHDFDGALKDLDRLLERTPRDGQARLTRATVRTVIGRYEDALNDCDALEGQALPVVVAACRGDAASRAGRAQEGYALIVRTLETGRGDAVVRAWAATTAAEIAQRVGDADAASRLYRQAIALDPASPYTLAAYADLLLDAGQPREAAALLEGKTRNDSLLLRYVLALRELPANDAYASHRAELAARMEAARRRGDGAHLREEARYALAIENDPAAALKLAHANWNAQREPADLLLLAQSARAAGDAAALKQVADWVARTRLEDAKIRALLKGGA
jgi:predicted Zn-dependent protease